jgi:putative membrane protein
MGLLSRVLVAFVALSHIGFLVLEMFFWDHAVGHRLFSMSAEFAAESAALAANQGLYNGFLAAGLLWALISGKRDLSYFFLSCVVIAGLFGAVTAKVSILFTQALPAAIALIVLFLAHRKSSHG